MNDMQLIDVNDVYSLFKPNGTATFHVADIDVIPRVDAAPVVHGYWINKTNPMRAVVEQRVDCSTCGHIFWHTSALSYNYCPNCGARMDGDTNGQCFPV
jgi:hypothetical protein